MTRDNSETNGVEQKRLTGDGSKTRRDVLKGVGKGAVVAAGGLAATSSSAAAGGGRPDFTVRGGVDGDFKLVGNPTKPVGPLKKQGVTIEYDVPGTTTISLAGDGWNVVRGHYKWRVKYRLSGSGSFTHWVSTGADIDHLYISSTGIKDWGRVTKTP